mgnify:CR=1 FL=1
MAANSTVSASAADRQDRTPAPVTLLMSQRVQHRIDAERVPVRTEIHEVRRIVTFALLLITYVVITEWDSVTGGAQSLNGVPTTATPGNTLPVVVGILVVAFLFQRSRR